jgi:hypothetical protein
LCTWMPDRVTRKRRPPFDERRASHLAECVVNLPQLER